MNYMEVFLSNGISFDRERVHPLEYLIHLTRNNVQVQGDSVIKDANFEMYGRITMMMQRYAPVLAKKYGLN